MSVGLVCSPRQLLASVRRSDSGAYAIGVGFIVAVSLYDAWLVVLYADSILWHEQNPVGLFLLRLNGGDPSLFVSLKLFGTLIVAAVLCWLFRTLRRLAVPVTVGVASVQATLLLYLSLM